MKKKIIYVVVGVLILILFYFLFLNKGDNGQESFIVVRGDVTEEIFETGSIKKGETVDLSFRETGRVASVLVSENQIVERGEIIASLEKGSLNIQLAEAQEAKRSADLALERLLIGSRAEDINIVRSALSSAESALRSAKTSLADTEKYSKEILSSAYRGVPSATSSALLATQVTLEDAKDFVDVYFGGFWTPEAVKAKSGRDKIYKATVNMEAYRNITREDLSFEEKDEALSVAQNSLRTALSGVEDIIESAKSDLYEDRIPSSAVDALRVRETRTMTDLDTISSLVQSTSSARVTAETALNTARSAVSSAESNLNRAQRDLERVTATPLEEEIKEREIAVRRAEAGVSLVEERIKDTYVRAPFSGRVSQVFGKVGELVSPGARFASLVSDDRFYIESYVYEGDIVKVDLEDPVDVEFVAFPGKVFQGEVSFINETGVLINNVVYYKINISLDDLPERVMDEMSVDIVIKSAEKKDVLLVPDRYLYRRDGMRIAKVIVNGQVEERIIETGVRGTNGMIEVISGVNEGDMIYE